MTKRNKIITVSILSAVAAIAGIWALILGYRNQTMSAFDYVKNKGATKTNSTTAGDRYDYGTYGFYSNNRAVVIGSNPAKKGTYNKEVILWDDGTKTLLIDIFK